MTSGECTRDLRVEVMSEVDVPINTADELLPDCPWPLT